MLEFREKYGPWAVVTGASRGIGKHFALALAERGLNTVLVARNQELLEQTAREICVSTGTQTRVVVADFSQPSDAVQTIHSKTSDLDVGLCVANAGMTQFCQLHTAQEPDLLEVIDVNITSTVLLLNYFSKRLIARGQGGGLIPVSSQGIYIMLPNEANYTASKAYVAKLGEIIHFELKRFGVDVTTLLPGLTDTDMITGHEMGEDWEWDFSKTPFKKMSPRSAVEEALNALGKKVSISPGAGNRIGLALMNIIPQSWRFKLYEKIFGKAVNPKYDWR
jgi:uncharacterized protein